MKEKFNFPQFALDFFWGGGKEKMGRHYFFLENIYSCRKVMEKEKTLGHRGVTLCIGQGRHVVRRDKLYLEQARNPGNDSNRIRGNCKPSN